MMSNPFYVFKAMLTDLDLSLHALILKCTYQQSMSSDTTGCRGATETQARKLALVRGNRKPPGPDQSAVSAVNLTKSSMQLHHLLIISPGSLSWFTEVAHEDLAVVVANLSTPPTVLTVPEHTPDSTNSSNMDTEQMHVEKPRWIDEGLPHHSAKA